MHFLVTNDRTYSGEYSPIQFVWYNCDDNSLADSTGRVLHVAKRVFDPDGSTMPESPDFPGYGGLPAQCYDGEDDLEKDVWFTNGGVEFCCYHLDDYTGDINVNAIAYEVADGHMFLDYFLYGLIAFDDHIDASIAMSDINGDGQTLTPEDLVMLWHIILGTGGRDRYLEPSPNTARFRTPSPYQELILETQDVLGFVHVVFYGDGEPQLVPPGLEMEYHRAGDTTSMWIAGAIKSGSLLTFSNSVGIKSVDAATIDGRDVNVVADIVVDVEDIQSDLPTVFSLSQNYPNPFNPETVIGFALPRSAYVEIDIFNIVGQKVTTLIGRQMPAGNHEVRWNGRDESGSLVASGVYLYRLTAGDFADTRKMLLMK
jgi:hypothetical protein